MAHDWKTFEVFLTHQMYLVKKNNYTRENQCIVTDFSSITNKIRTNLWKNHITKCRSNSSTTNFLLGMEPGFHIKYWIAYIKLWEAMRNILSYDNYKSNRSKLIHCYYSLCSLVYNINNFFSTCSCNYYICRSMMYC